MSIQTCYFIICLFKGASIEIRKIVQLCIRHTDFFLSFAGFLVGHALGQDVLLKHHLL